MLISNATLKVTYQQMESSREGLPPHGSGVPSIVLVPQYEVS
jgi:hypothetical protein